MGSFTSQSLIINLWGCGWEGESTEGSLLSITLALQSESSHSQNWSGKHTTLSKSFINLILRLTKETKDK